MLSLEDFQNSWKLNLVLQAPSTLTWRDLKIRFALWKHIKHFPSTPVLDTQQSPAICVSSGKFRQEVSWLSWCDDFWKGLFSKCIPSTLKGSQSLLALRVFSTSSVLATNRPLVWMEPWCVKSNSYCFNKSRGQKQFDEPLKISCSCMCERVMLVFFFSLPIGWQSCGSLFQSCLFQSFFNTWVKIAVLFTLAVCEGAILVDVELKLFERLKVIKMALLDFF